MAQHITTEDKPELFPFEHFVHWVGDKLQLTYITQQEIKTEDISSSEPSVTIDMEANGTKHTIPLQTRYTPPPTEYKEVKKALFIGDVHGTFDNVAQFLLKNKVIDQQLNWTWKDGHLVFCGDVVDRGLKVNQTLWLIYKLKQQAEQSGGYVHYLLGNHEAMLMQNDLRYANPVLLDMYNRHTLNYTNQYSESSLFGQWLRNRNAVMKINDILISHAGISPQLAALNLSLEEINQHVREQLVSTDYSNLFTGSRSPLWYRGYLMSWYDYTRISQIGVDQILNQYNVSNIIVAHTTVDVIKKLFQGKVVAIDLDVNNSKTKLEGLLWEDGLFYRMLMSGKRMSMT